MKRPSCPPDSLTGAAEPSGLVEAMIAHGMHLEGNEVVHLMTLGSAPYVQPGLEKRFRHTAFFIGPVEKFGQEALAGTRAGAPARKPPSRRPFREL